MGFHAQLGALCETALKSLGIYLNNIPFYIILLLKAVSLASRLVIIDVFLSVA